VDGWFDFVKSGSGVVANGPTLSSRFAAAPRMPSERSVRRRMLGFEGIVMSQRVVTVTEVLCALDIQCPSRIYLNC
jgi:hypothetical protein